MKKLNLFRTKTKKVRSESSSPTLINTYSHGNVNYYVGDEPSRYTLKDMIANGAPDHNMKKCAACVHQCTENCTKEALRAYNRMLIYLDSLQISYKIYDFYYVSQFENYILKVILSDWILEYQRDKTQNQRGAEPFILMLSCKKDGTNMESTVIPFLMARKMQEDIKEEFKIHFPDYHINFFYLNLDVVNSSVNKYGLEDKENYHLYYQNSRLYSNVLNIVVPVGTQIEDADSIYEQVKPLLIKYHITQVNILATPDENAYQRLIDRELITNNHYLYKDKEEVAWIQEIDLRYDYAYAHDKENKICKEKKYSKTSDLKSGLHKAAVLVLFATFIMSVSKLIKKDKK